MAWFRSAQYKCLLYVYYEHDIYFRNVVSIDFVSGILQPCFQHVEHTRLKRLIQGLPAVLLKSKAEYTTKKYERGFNAWRKWASQFKEIVIFFLCCLFLCHWVFNLFSRSFSSFYTRLVLTHPISGCLLHDKCFIFG